MTIAESGIGDKQEEERGEGQRSLQAALSAMAGDWVLIGIIVLSSSLCFGLGLLAARANASESSKNPENRLWIEQLPAEERAVGTSTIFRDTKGAGTAFKPSGLSTQTSNALPTHPAAAAADIATPHTYVASKSGAKYYLPSCGTVSRIKEENRVYFATKADAEKAGYQPSSSCKGL